jgi:uncharacterized protein
MNDLHIEKIAGELKFKEAQVKAVAALLEAGATVPFIARYRKEATGSLDEVAVTSIRDRLRILQDLDDRKQTILKSLEQHGHLNEELEQKVLDAETMTVLEDIYLPYKPKRRTRAQVAKEKGLEPLALEIFEQKGEDPEKLAEGFIDQEKSVTSIAEALAGARDIIAEMINEDALAREKVRRLFVDKAVLWSRVAPDKEVEGIKYRDYYDWQEPALTAPSHRILAIRRGEREGFLHYAIQPEEEEALNILFDLFIKGSGEDSEQVRAAIVDGYKRLLSISIGTEMRLQTKKGADEEAIKVFTANLRQLLLAPPLGQKRVLGLDPGFRTGCKVACLDAQGRLFHHETVYLHLTEQKDQEASQQLAELCRNYEIEAIAVGNGTAGRETAAFIRNQAFSKDIPVILVNESGASIYSASEIARKEFPDLDLTVRGAISIGRRLMDPLAELVKIDPKSIGVGQYQHDVDQTALRQALDDVVASCVNAVGVEVNTASVPLLTYVSGLGPQLAENIVTYRDENGPFQSRMELQQVKRLGPKAFEQSAGFLRIQNSLNPLDTSAVHPESYHIVDEMASDLGCDISKLIGNQELIHKIDVKKYSNETIGLPTLNDILSELVKPGRDPRQELELFSFAEGVNKIEDLEPGMKLPGIVTNITAFGAFVDIGVHQDGLVHISHLADRFVKNPADVVKVQQRVMVKVLEVDLQRKRISLSMREENGAPKADKKKPESKRSRKQKQRKQRQRVDKTFNNPFAEAFKKNKT